MSHYDGGDITKCESLTVLTTLIHGNQSFDREKKIAGVDELSQNVKVLDRPALPAHFNNIYASCNEHDTVLFGYQVDRQK